MPVEINTDFNQFEMTTESNGVVKGCSNGIISPFTL